MSEHECRATDHSRYVLMNAAQQIINCTCYWMPRNISLSWLNNECSTSDHSPRVLMNAAQQFINAKCLTMPRYWSYSPHAVGWRSSVFSCGKQWTSWSKLLDSSLRQGSNKLKSEVKSAEDGRAGCRGCILRVSNQQPEAGGGGDMDGGPGGWLSGQGRHFA